MDQNKKFLAHVDVLGFVEQAKQVEKIHAVPSWQARRNVIEKVDNIIKTHIKVNKYAKTSSDSWMFLFDNAISALECLRNIKQVMEKEYNSILLEIAVTYGNIECDDFWLTDEAMLAVEICEGYRKIHRHRHNDFPRKSFLLIHSSAYKELDAVVQQFELLTREKIGEQEVIVFDPSFYKFPYEIMPISKESAIYDDVEKFVNVEKHQVFLYDAAHLGDTIKKSIIRSKKIDLYLYTAETFAITYRGILKEHKGISIRILTLDPEYVYDSRKRTSALACMELWKEIADLNRNCKISMKLYAHQPLLRAIIFDNSEGFLSIYRYERDHPFHFVGVEDNKLIYVKRNTLFGQFFLDLYQSRFEYEWENSRKPEG